MSNITVFVFLLESVPGFENSLKSTLQSVSGKYNNVFSKCDPYAADLIWNHVNKNLKNEMNHFPNKYRSEVLNDNFISSEIYDNTLENNDIENDLIDNHDNNNNKFQKLSKNIYKTKNFEFPENAPFLVAIFETITNITAQTCGGTLISPHWVLTAASCLNLLPSFYKKLTKQNKFHKSYYTIIANAKNPLTDGTVHNVTRVVLHPKYKFGIKKNLIKTESQITLMRIEPAANIHAIHIFKGKIKLGTGVRVYGWTLQKNSTDDSTGEYMGITAVSAKITDSRKCKANYNFLNENSLICLSADNESRAKISQMSSGGPVLVYSEGHIKILAVAQIDTSSRIIAYALTNYDWIKDIINT